MFRKLFTGLKNLYYWLPIVWQDRQWDSHYLFKIIEHKLCAMEKWYSSDKPVACNSEKVLRRVLYCRVLAMRIVKDEYLGNALSFHKAKYGEPYIFCKPCPNGYWELIEIAIPGLFGWEREWEKRERRRLGRHADQQKEYEIAELFRLMRKHILDWWD